MQQKEHIAKYVALGPQYAKQWIGLGSRNSIKNARATLAPGAVTDDWAKGIWANKVGKVVLNLWRVRWRNLPTKDRLINRGMTITGQCELCVNNQETTDNLFVDCTFTRWILKEAIEAAGGLVNLDKATNFEEAAYELNKVSKGSPAWGLQWSLYGISLFHIWKQRNLRRVTARKESPQTVLRQIIGMAEIGFDSGKYKTKTMTTAEKQALHQWDVLLMLIHTDEGS